MYIIQYISHVYHTITIVIMFLWIELFAIIVSSTVFDTSVAISHENMLANEQQNNFKNISAACSNFANPFYKSLLSFISTEINIVISPLNVYIMMSLLSNHAEGSTLNELKSVLHFDDEISFNDKVKALIILLNDIKNELQITNTAYVQEEIEIMDDFLPIYKNNFISVLAKVDFRNDTHAAKMINLLIRGITNNKMSNVMLPDLIDESTNFILINTVYFKPRWLHIFDEKDTEQQIFHASTIEKYLVPTMFKDSVYKYGIIENWRCRFIEIPYLNEDMVIIILLPDREITLETLENNFNWQTLINTRSFPSPILLYLPKFKFEITIDIKNVLHKIGLKKMFEDQANFTRLSKSPLKVSRVLQKMIIRVNEKGSEFPAKVVNVKQTSKRNKPNKLFEGSKTFIVNRPFMFAIEHKPTRMPLFLGSIRKPNTSNRFVRPKNDEL